MHGAFPSAGFILGTAEMLLFPFHALGGDKVHFRFAVVAVEQSRKKARPAGFRWSALLFAKLLHSQPLFLGDERLAKKIFAECELQNLGKKASRFFTLERCALISYVVSNSPLKGNLYCNFMISSKPISIKRRRHNCYQ